MSRFVSFHNSLIASDKFPVRFLARLLENDLRSVHGRNLSNIALLCGVDGTTELHALKPMLVKKKVRYRTTPLHEEWRVTMCKELLQMRDSTNLELPGFTADEQKAILDHLCAS